MALLTFSLLAYRADSCHTPDVFCENLPDTYPHQTLNIFFLHFPQDATLEEMVEQMGVMVGFVSKPKVIRDGQAAMCILRPPSAKELSQKEKTGATALQSATSSSKATQNNTVNVGTTEGSLQQ